VGKVSFVVLRLVALCVHVAGYQRFSGSCCLHLQGFHWKVDNYSAGQKESMLSWNPKIHYRIRVSPLFDPVLSWFIAVLTFTQSFRKIHFKNILSFKLRSPSGVWPWRVSEKKV